MKAYWDSGALVEAASELLTTDQYDFASLTDKVEVVVI